MTIRAAPLAEKLKVLNELKRIKEEEESLDQQYELMEKSSREDLEEVRSRSREDQQEARTLPDHIRQEKLRRCTERESMYESNLEDLIKEREQWMKKRIPNIDKEIKQREKELQESNDFQNFQMDLFTIGNRWVQKDAESTLFAAFEICRETGRHFDKVHDRYGRYFDKVHDGSIGECMIKMLEILPDAAKIVMTRSRSNQAGEMSEALHVVYNTRSDIFVSSMLEVLSKRWKTLDLVSMMQEVQRNLNYKEQFWHRKENQYVVEIKDSLSTIPILHEAEES